MLGALTMNEPIVCTCGATIDLQKSYGCRICRTPPMCRDCFREHESEHDFNGESE
jgi:hypothetical protein